MNHEISPRIERHMSKKDIGRMERKMEEWGIDIDTIIAVVESALKEIEENDKRNDDQGSV